MNHTHICHLRRVKCGVMDTPMSLTPPVADGQRTLTNHRRTHTSLFATTGAGRGDWSYPVAPASTGLLTRKTAKSSGAIRGDGRPPSQFPSLNQRQQKCSYAQAGPCLCWSDLSIGMICPPLTHMY